MKGAEEGAGGIKDGFAEDGGAFCVEDLTWSASA